MQADRRRQGGFTLLEIMVVVTILGLLATIVATNVFRHFATAQEEAARTEVAQIHAAAQTFYMRHLRIPTLQDLIDPPPELEGFTEIPKDPWRNAYVLRPTGEGATWEVLSLGPDGTEGTDDDISTIGLRDR